MNYYRAIGWTLLSLLHAGQQIHDVIIVFRNTMFWPISELHVSDHVFSDCSFLNMKTIRIFGSYKQFLETYKNVPCFYLW